MKGKTMQEIILTQNKVALIDDEDYEKIASYNWYADWGSWTCYAKTDQLEGRPRMHVVLLTPAKGFYVNHIDGNGLNNQRNNIEIVSASTNAAKSKRRYTAQNKYRGVEFNGYVYFARITVNYKKYYLGSFHSPEEAALAFNKASLSLRGPGHPLNEVSCG